MERRGGHPDPEKRSLKKGFVIDDKLRAEPLGKEFPEVMEGEYLRYPVPEDPVGAHYFRPTRKSEVEIEEAKSRLRAQNVESVDDAVFFDRIFSLEVNRLRRDEKYKEIREDIGKSGRWIIS